MRNAIPLFRPLVAADARLRAAKVLASGWLGYGPECRELEATFLRGRGGFALATGSCTAALYLAALALRRQTTAREVVVPSMTFVSTAIAFHHAGFRVRIADVDPRDLMLRAHSVAPLVGADTAAVVAVHLYGQYCSPLPQLRDLCDTHGIALIEDCAHRLDLLDPRAPLGDFACYSFNAVKEVPCGEGGVLWGRDAAQESSVRALSNAGLAIDTMQRSASTRHADYLFTQETGLKLRLSDVAAALVNGALPLLAQWRVRRAAQFARYDEALRPLAPLVRSLARTTDDACLMYVIRVPAGSRDAIRERLAAEDIATSVHYPSLMRHPLFGEAAEETGIDLDDTLVTLPTYLEMDDVAERRVVAALTEACADACCSTPEARRSSAPRTLAQ